MSQSFEPIIVTTTGDDPELLESMATQLIERKLAACVQVSSPILSFYRWEGRIERGNEWCLVIKTARAMYDQVEQSILEQHNYDQPQVVAVPIIGGSPGYLSWLKDQLNEGSDE